MSVDLSVEEEREVKLDDEKLLDMLASKHRIKDDGKIIHIAIIDYLTRYNTFKKIEKFVKSWQAPQETISVADPIFYGDRFQKFMLTKVLADKI